MNQILRLLNLVIRKFIIGEVILNHRAEVVTTSSTTFVPMTNQGLRPFKAVAAWRTENGSVIEVRFGYYDRKGKLVLNDPVFRSPPVVHFDIREKTACPIVHNVSPEGFDVWVLGSVGKATPKCALYVRGKKRPRGWREVFLFLGANFLLTFGTVLLALRALRDFYVFKDSCIFGCAVVLGALFSISGFRSSRRISGQISV